jgi:threonine dehydrogenase-like Zn-dependent dehydrogenase
MRAFTITAPNAGEVRDVPSPRPGPGEAIVRPAFVGICGTDYHIFQGDFLSPYPLTNGHEFSGTIVALGTGGGAAASGPAASRWREADRVTVDPTLTCGHCFHCRRGQSNHCDEWGAIGDTTAGALAELVKVPIRNLYRRRSRDARGRRLHRAARVRRLGRRAAPDQAR